MMMQCSKVSYDFGGKRIVARRTVIGCATAGATGPATRPSVHTPTRR